MPKWTPKKINSLYHPLVKHLVKLKDKKSHREETQSILVAGRKIVGELLPHFPAKTLFLLNDEPSFSCPETYIVTFEILKKITGLSTPDGVAAEFPLPPPSSLKNFSHILALEKISDPGNLGTIMRTACAFGWQGVFLLPGCVDLFNDKTIRSSRGACFYLPYFHGEWKDLLELAHAKNLPLYVADIDGQPFDELSHQKGAILLLSHEGEGVSDQAKQLGKRICIPQNTLMESLNVAIAGGILLYHFHPQKKSSS